MKNLTANSWKKAISLVLCLALLFMIGCSSAAKPSSTSEPAPASSQEANAPEKSNFPSKAITVIIPQDYGGGFDLVARAFASVAPEVIGVPMIITAMPGGSTVVGTSAVVNATPDGYTLLFGGIQALVLGHFQDIDVNVMEDLIPICGVTQQSWIMGVPGDASPKPSPFHTLEELVAYAKEHPGEIQMSNSGPMTNAQLAQLLLEKQAGIEFTHIPYQGGGPNRLAWKSAEIDASVGPDSWVVQESKDGYIRPLAVAGNERLASLPDVPTFKELGYDIVANAFYGFYAPKGTPQAILDYLEESFLKVAENSSFQKLCEQMDNVVVIRNSKEAASFLAELDAGAAAAAEAYNAK